MNGQFSSWWEFMIAVILFIAPFIWFNSVIQQSASRLNKKTYQMEKNSHSYNSSSQSSGNIITSMNQLTEQLVTQYFKLTETMHLTSSFNITPQELLDLLGNKRIFPFENSRSCETSIDGSICRIKIEISYTQGCKIFMSILNSENIEKLSETDQMVFDKIKDIHNKITNPLMDSLQKEKTIHDYLISTSKYDHENFLKDTIPAVSYTPYGLLYNHIAVCQAYSETFMIFMILSNIECHMVVGKAIVDGFVRINDSHAWNIVKIKGRYYHVDVTFDNPVPYVIGKVSHNYFNKTDDFMDKTHLWNTSQYPICS